MSWPCRLLPERPANPQPGDMWPRPDLVGGDWVGGYCSELLSPEYARGHLGKRAPLEVFLPSGDEWIVDAREVHDGQLGARGWTVTGEAPALTVSPSILVRGRSTYHGFLQNGVLSDDCEGRRFP